MTVRLTNAPARLAVGLGMLLLVVVIAVAAFQRSGGSSSPPTAVTGCHGAQSLQAGTKPQFTLLPCQWLTRPLGTPFRVVPALHRR